MKTKNVLTLVVISMIAFACGHKADSTEQTMTTASTCIEGDSTIYGLACDGCNDTVVVFLRSPYNGSDPDTLNILDATRHHRVFGRPLIGDQLAIIRNAADTTIADLLIVTEDLQAQWCYRVLPTLRERADMEGVRTAELPDSVKALLSVEREYGFQLKNEGVAFPIGMGYRAATTDEEEEVVYPELTRYFEWHIYNGQLVLESSMTDSLKQRHITVSDTAEITMLSPDTLVLRFSDHEQGYYKRRVVTETENEEKKDE